MTYVKVSLQLCNVFLYWINYKVVKQIAIVANQFQLRGSKDIQFQNITLEKNSIFSSTVRYLKSVSLCGQ